MSWRTLLTSGQFDSFGWLRKNATRRRYEINFNRYFYLYIPPRPLEEIEADIRAIEQDILMMLAEVAGSG